MGQSSKELFPLPLPYPQAGKLCHAAGHSRSVRRQLRRSGMWQQWANDAVQSLNCLAGRPGEQESAPSVAQQVSLDGLVEPFKRMGLPPADLYPAEAFRELCGTMPGYTEEVAGCQAICQGSLVTKPMCTARVVKGA